MSEGAGTEIIPVAGRKIERDLVRARGAAVEADHHAGAFAHESVALGRGLSRHPELLAEADDVGGGGFEDDGFGGPTDVGRAQTEQLHLPRDLFQLPILAKDGAIVPMADGVIRVFGSARNSFSWYDDDGATTAISAATMTNSRLRSAAATSRSPERGDLAPTTLVWTRPDLATEVRIDGNVAPFTPEGTTLTVSRPAEAPDTTISRPPRFPNRGFGGTKRVVLREYHVVRRQ